MSGGVDSSVAAALLKYGGLSAGGGPTSGWDVRGIHIKMWSDPSIPCNFKEDRYDAIKVAAHLDIPLETWDLTKEYKKEVVEYMIREYAAGRTPNPDVMCNRRIKFGVFLRKALAAGADFVATGHYVQRVPSPSTQCVECSTRPREIKLLKGVDDNKDQSYFLWTLDQEQLKHCLFPIGEYTKPEVRAMAKKFGLSTAEKKDSQGICFIGEINIREFLKNYIPAERGPVVTTSGKKVGEHEGLSFYTIGQREGLGTGGGGIPFYVTTKDFSSNTLIVAEGPYDEKLFQKKLAVTDINWISGQRPKLPLSCETRIRYRQPLQKCSLKSMGYRSRRAITTPTSLSGKQNETSGPQVIFQVPQRAVTPGQSIVFYQNDEMIGGGVIA